MSGVLCLRVSLSVISRRRLRLWWLLIETAARCWTLECAYSDGRELRRRTAPGAVSLHFRRRLRLSCAPDCHEPTLPPACRFVMTMLLAAYRLHGERVGDLRCRLGLVARRLPRSGLPISAAMFGEGSSYKIEMHNHP